MLCRQGGGTGAEYCVASEFSFSFSPLGRSSKQPGLTVGLANAASMHGRVGLVYSLPLPAIRPLCFPLSALSILHLPSGARGLHPIPSARDESY